MVCVYITAGPSTKLFRWCVRVFFSCIRVCSLVVPNTKLCAWGDSSTFVVLFYKISTFLSFFLTRVTVKKNYICRLQLMGHHLRHKEKPAGIRSDASCINVHTHACLSRDGEQRARTEKELSSGPGLRHRARQADRLPKSYRAQQSVH
jgi:hypothetical protein